MPKLSDMVAEAEQHLRWLDAAGPATNIQRLYASRQVIERLLSEMKANVIPHTRELELTLLLHRSVRQMRPIDWDLVDEADRRTEALFKAGKLDYGRHG